MPQPNPNADEPRDGSGDAHDAPATAASEAPAGTGSGDGGEAGMPDLHTASASDSLVVMNDPGDEDDDAGDDAGDDAPHRVAPPPSIIDDEATWASSDVTIEPRHSQRRSAVTDDVDLSAYRSAHELLADATSAAASASPASPAGSASDDVIDTRVPPSDVDVVIPPGVFAPPPAPPPDVPEPPPEPRSDEPDDDDDETADSEADDGDVAPLATAKVKAEPPPIELVDPITDLEQVVPRGRFAEYIIRKEIGHGSMSRVMAASHPAARRTAAIKLLDPKKVAKNPEMVARFEREARAIRKLDHPNIVSIYEIDTFHGVHYIAMEHIRGKNLQHILGRSEKRLFTPRLAASIILRAADALRYAFAAGVVHRDVKLDNIMLDGEKTVKVLDFGCALDTTDDGERVSREFTVVGSPNYMSPEQARGLKVDFRTDIYSLGICFYFMVTGRFPFIARDPIALIRKHVFDPPKPPSEVNPGIPPDVELVILRMLAKQPTERHRSYDELIAQLENIAEGRRPDSGMLPPGAVLGDEVGTPQQPGTSSQVILLANREVEEILALDGVNNAIGQSGDQWALPTELEVVSDLPASPVAFPHAELLPVAAPPILAPAPPVHVAAGSDGTDHSDDSIRAPQMVEGRRPRRAGVPPPPPSPSPSRPPARRTDRMVPERPPARRSGTIRPGEEASATPPRPAPPGSRISGTPPARRSGRIRPDDDARVDDRDDRDDHDDRDDRDDRTGSGSGSGRMPPINDPDARGPRIPPPRRRTRRRH
ncbi:MAG: serine/threonine-protein kinase [Planctomycetota bacterium]